MVLSLFFTSCNLLSDDDSGTLSINLPPIVSNSRSIAGERIEFLKNATASYRVTVNGMTREGTGVNYEFTLPVGTMANITVECLNSNGEVILRAFKEHKVVGGDNSVSISLKNDGNEIINGGVTYSYGDAAAGGAVTGFPSSVKVGVGEKFTVTGDANSITWDHGTFNGWITNVALKGDADSGTGDVAAGDTVPAGTYIMPSQNVILTAQWQKKQYIITYNTNSPAGANVSSVANLPMTDALTQVTLATAPTVTNNPVTSGSDQKNYTFLHWRDTSDGTTYSASTQITLTKSMTLEAVWSDETVYTVTFVSPPKSVSVQYDQQIPSSPQTVEVGNSLSWINPSALGWTFGGWEVSDAGDSSVTELPESATSYTPKGNTTLTAKLTAKSYTVNYDVRNGEGTAPNPAPKTIVSWDSAGGNFARNDGAGFSRPGYILTSWEFSDGTSAGTKGVTGGGRKFMEMADGNNSVTVYAVWERVYKTAKADWEVGDIVLNNSSGTVAINPNAYTARDATTYGDGVAVVYKNEANKVYIVGKVHEKNRLAWSPQNSEGNNTLFTSLQCEPDDINVGSGNYTWTQGQNTDGSSNWQKLQQELQASGKDDTSTEENYPAWYWANNYGSNQSLSGDLENNWYLPSIAELFDIWKAKDKVEASLTAAGGSMFDSINGSSVVHYCSSTQVASSATGMYPVEFNSGNIGSYRKIDFYYVCAVRQFTY